MNKKIISLLLAFVYVFSCIGVFANGYAEAETEKQAISFMVALNVMEETAINEPDRYVSRAEAAHYMVSTMLPDMSGTSRTIFADVNTDDAYAEDITTLTDMGIINAAALNFRPNENITGFELTKMIICMLGQDVAAEALGGYPVGYIQVAQKNRLLDSFSPSDKGVTLGEFAVFMAKALECKYVFYDGFDTFETENDSYMRSVLGIEKHTGILNDNGITCYTGKSGLNENEFSVGEKTFYFEDDITDLIGSYVTVFYKTKETVRDAYKVVSVKRDNNRTEVTTLKYDDISSFKNNTYTYYNENDKEKTLKVDGNTVVIYNGIALSPEQYRNNLDIYVPEYGTVQLINNNSSAVIDVVRISDYRNIVVSSYNKELLTIYGMESASPIVLTDTDYIIKDLVGVETDFEIGIKSGNVLMVAESLDKDYTEIIFCNNKIEGRITEVNSSDNTVKINDGLYIAAVDCNLSLSLGIDGVFYLNAWNNIVYVEPGLPDGYTVAYVINAAKGEGLSGTNMIRVYTHYDMLKTLEMADKVRVDGELYSGNSATVETILQNNVDEIVLLKFNSVGEVNRIDTPLNNNDKGISPVDGLHHSNTRYHNNPGSTFAGKMFVTDNSYCFVVPQKMDEKQISVFKGKTAYQNFLKGVQIDQEVAVYRYGNDDSVEVFALANKTGISGTIRGKGCPYLVTDIAKTFNSQGEIAYKLSLNRNGTISEIYTANEDDIVYTCDGNTYTIGKGDLILFGTDKFGFMSKGQLSDANKINQLLENITLIYDAETNWFNYRFTPDYSNEYSVDMNTKFCYVYDKTDLPGHYKVTLNDPSAVVNESEIIAYDFSGMRNILLFDARTQTIVPITYDEFVTYKAEPENCTKLVFFMNYINNGGFCVVYE